MLQKNDVGTELSASGSFSVTGRCWDVRPRLSQEGFKVHQGIAPLLVQLLHNRGIRELEDVTDFLFGDAKTYDPFLMSGMEAATARILRAVTNSERVCIYADYDADGVTSCVILTLTLRSLGILSEPYFPNRRIEGYGLNKEAIAHIAESGIELLISTDCGANAVSEVEVALAQGMDVIVTDHHTVLEDLPAAAIALNPRNPKDPYPFPDLAGVGVAYKLAEALLRKQPSIKAINPESLMDLVALGTVADVVPLRGENRYFVVEGLKRINHAPRPGIAALMSKSRITYGEVVSSDLGFKLGPRINAAGRMDDARIAFNSLIETEHQKVEELAQQLEEWNLLRQQATREILEAAEQFVDGDGPIFAYGEDWHPGVVGLVAGKLAEATGVPAFVASIHGGIVRGSVRAQGGVNIVEALGSCSHILDRYGGHARAGGFTVARSRLFEMRDEVCAWWDTVGSVRTPPVLEVDCYLWPQSLNWDTLQLVQDLGPFGESFRDPLFAMKAVMLSSWRVVGRDGTHLKPEFAGFGEYVSAIWFGGGAYASSLEVGKSYDVCFKIGKSTYQGQSRIDMLVEDLRVTE
jgi:single-stranded-DNA-specific exonuclease